MSDPSITSHDNYRVKEYLCMGKSSVGGVYKDGETKERLSSQTGSQIIDED